MTGKMPQSKNISTFLSAPESIYTTPRLRIDGELVLTLSQPCSTSQTSTSHSLDHGGLQEEAWILNSEKKVEREVSRCLAVKGSRNQIGKSEFT